MTNHELHEYIVTNEELESLKKQFEVLHIKGEVLKRKAKQLLAPDNEAIFETNNSEFYRIFLDGDDDIQLSRIRKI